MIAAPLRPAVLAAAALFLLLAVALGRVADARAADCATTRITAPPAAAVPADGRIVHGTVPVSVDVTNTSCAGTIALTLQLKNLGTLVPSPGPALTSPPPAGAPEVLTFSGLLDTTGFADGLYDLQAAPSGDLVTAAAPVRLLIDNTAPVITLSGPAENELVPAGTSITFAANTEPDLSGIASLRCAYDAAPLVSPCSSAGSPSALTAGTHSFRVEAQDGAGNVGSLVRYTTASPRRPPPRRPPTRSSPPRPRRRTSRRRSRPAGCRACAGSRSPRPSAGSPRRTAAWGRSRGRPAAC